MASTYPQIFVAVESTIVEVKKKFLADIETFVLSKLDDDSVEAIKDCFSEFRAEFEKEVASAAKKASGKGAKKEKKEKADRKPSEYNVFVGNMIKEIRAKNAGLPAKEAMKMAMALWKEKKNAAAP